MRTQLLTIKSKIVAIIAVFIFSFTVFSHAAVYALDWSANAGSQTSRFTGVDTSTNKVFDPVGTYTLYDHLTEARGLDEKTAFSTAAAYHSSLYAANLAYGQARNRYEEAGNSPITADTVYSNIGNSTAAVNAYKNILLAEKNQYLVYKNIVGTTGYTGPVGGHTLDAINGRISLIDSYLSAIEEGKVVPGGNTSEDTNITGAVIFGEDPIVSVTRDQDGDVVKRVNSKITCEVTSAEGLVGCIAIGAYNILLKGSALVLALVGMVFNMSLNFTLNIGELFKDSAFGLGGTTGAIYIGWSTIRNFINIIFIFVLLYVAISTIIQNDKYGAKKMVTKIVIAALLINFSLFFAKAVVDLSNILALQFYARILESAKQVNGGASNADQIDAGLSSAMLNAIGLESLWSGDGGSPEGKDAAQFGAANGLDAYNLLALSIFGGGFILLFSLVLFVGIAQLLMRTIVILFLLITSPFGFIGEAIPALGGVASDWRKRLTNNAIFAPAYLAILFVICQIMFGNANGKIIGDGNFRNLIIGTNQEQVGSIGIMFWFLLLMGLLITGQGAARAFADKFGKGFVDKAEEAFKGKGKYGWRKGASWTAGKAWGGAKASAKWTGGKISDKLRQTPIANVASRILPKKTRDAWYQAGVDRAKDKANNLRRGENESDEKYEARQAEIIGKAQEAQFKSMGLNRGDFDNKAYSYTENGVTYTKYKYGAMNKDVAKRMKARAQEKFSRGRRKRRTDSIERLEGAFGPAKPGSSDDVKARLKKAKDDYAALKTSTHDAITVQLKAEVDSKTTAIETTIRNGGIVTPQDRKDLRDAKKDLADHLAQQNKLEKDVADLEEKLEKVKKEEKDRAEKEKEKNKKK